MMDKCKLYKKFLLWLAGGDVGASSKSLGYAILDIDYSICHPSDPSDFNRCLLLLEEIPEFKKHLHKAKNLSKTWELLIHYWDDLQKVFIDEVGIGWSKKNRAPKTYEFMKNLGC